MTEDTPTRLAAIQARVAKATAGPWFTENDRANGISVFWRQDGMICPMRWTDGMRADVTARVEADAAFIASAREDIPWLLTEHASLQAELKDERTHRLHLQQTLDSWQKQIKRLQAERNELRNAIAGCGEHTPNVSHAYMVALAKDNAEAEEALNGDAGAKVQLEAAEAARDEAKYRVSILEGAQRLWQEERLTLETVIRNEQAHVGEAQRQTAALRAALEKAQEELGEGGWFSEDMVFEARAVINAALAAGTETP